MKYDPGLAAAISLTLLLGESQRLSMFEPDGITFAVDTREDVKHT